MFLESWREVLENSFVELDELMPFGFQVKDEIRRTPGDRIAKGVEDGRLARAFAAYDETTMTATCLIVLTGRDEVRLQLPDLVLGGKVSEI